MVIGKKGLDVISDSPDRHSTLTIFSLFFSAISSLFAFFDCRCSCFAVNWHELPARVASDRAYFELEEGFYHQLRSERFR